MRLSNVSLSGFSRLADRELVLGHAHPGGSFTTVTGGPGSGKTALLELLVAAKEGWAPSGVRVPWRPDSADGKGAKLATTWTLGERTVEVEAIFDSEFGFQPEIEDGFRDCLTGYSLSPSLYKWEYFHDGRAIAPAGRVELRSARRLEIEERKYGVVEPLLAQAFEAGRAADRLALANKALGEFGLAIEPADGGAIQIATPRGARGVHQLSGAERHVLLVIGSIVALGLDSSLLLVDTLEHGLSDAWAEKLGGVLPTLAPRAQIIATTRKPSLFSNAQLTVELKARKA